MTATQKISRHEQRDAERLGGLRTAAWDALRAFNARPNGPNAAAVDSATVALESACELYRQRYAHPRASEVFVTCDQTIGQALTVWQRRPARDGSATEAIYTAAATAS